ncbi:MAG: serine hydrolase [Candidatus Endonucleobacter bathymodioli]|uniref:Serine hydrolase n=1 Tax=Candidatus Endonucleibacter bathymodioli TaxID=539814 RepID=A0AA90NJ44_9GAMM|nr:serine hydrolase [Candidatus Endonucleobacter bathymodioli]
MNAEGISDHKKSKDLAQAAAIYSDSEKVVSWMKGFPPPKDRVIRFADDSYRQWPQLRWSYGHMEELVPTKTVWRGNGHVKMFEKDPVNLDDLTIQTTGNVNLSFQQALDISKTDGILVIYRGKVVYEKYFAYTDQYTRHIIQSATKSFIGTIAEELVQKQVLNKSKFITHYLPELRGTAWDDATLENVMDMQVSMVFDENYLDSNSEVYNYLKSAGMIPLTSKDKGPISIYHYLPQIKKDGEHGKVFAYREPNINVLGWVVRRTTNMSLAELVSKWFWQPIGAERDSYFMLDGWGVETAMSMTLRDFARFGELIRNNGIVDGKRLLHSATIDTFFKGGDRDKFAQGGPKVLAGWSYKSQWWVRHHNNQTSIEARGSNGQFLYIDRNAEVVIARFGSAEQSSSTNLEPIMSPLIDAIIKAIIKNTNSK